MFTSLLCICYDELCLGSEATLNYQMIVKRYPFSNGVVGGSIIFVKSSLYLIRKNFKNQKNKNKKIKN